MFGSYLQIFTASYTDIGMYRHRKTRRGLRCSECQYFHSRQSSTNAKKQVITARGSKQKNMLDLGGFPILLDHDTSEVSRFIKTDGSLFYVLGRDLKLQMQYILDFRTYLKAVQKDKSSISSKRKLSQTSLFYLSQTFTNNMSSKSSKKHYTLDFSLFY